jgi:hypothetical protein
MKQKNQKNYTSKVAYLQSIMPNDEDWSKGYDPLRTYLHILNMNTSLIRDFTITTYFDSKPHR